MLLALLLVASWPINTKSVEFVKEFPQDEDEFLGTPTDACFSPDGKLFVIDSSASKIFTWNADGTFKKTFAQKGGGPGELQNPFSITADKDHVYVWEDRQYMSVFNHNGQFEHGFHTNGSRPRSFGVVGPDLLLLGYRTSSADKMFMHFDLWKASGEKAKTLYKEQNLAFLAVGEGDNNAYIKSYMPEIEVTTGPNGNLYYGFSQTNKVYEMDAKGEMVAEHTFELPTSLPDELDKDVVHSMSFPGPGGQRLSLKDMPNIRMSFADPKAHYTHFMISGGKVAFVLTPIGSTDGLSNGYARASFYICDLKSGKVLKRGRYDLSEDSAVFYQNGRAVAAVLDEEGEFRIREMRFKGM